MGKKVKHKKGSQLRSGSELCTKFCVSRPKQDVYYPPPIVSLKIDGNLNDFADTCFQETGPALLASFEDIVSCIKENVPKNAREDALSFFEKITNSRQQRSDVSAWMNSHHKREATCSEDMLTFGDFTVDCKTKTVGLNLNKISDFKSLLERGVNTLLFEAKDIDTSERNVLHLKLPEVSQHEEDSKKAYESFLEVTQDWNKDLVLPSECTLGVVGGVSGSLGHRVIVKEYVKLSMELHQYMFKQSSLLAELRTHRQEFHENESKAKSSAIGSEFPLQGNEEGAVTESEKVMQYLRNEHYKESAFRKERYEESRDVIVQSIRTLQVNIIPIEDHWLDLLRSYFAWLSQHMASKSSEQATQVWEFLDHCEGMHRQAIMGSRYVDRDPEMALLNCRKIRERLYNWMQDLRHAQMEDEKGGEVGSPGDCKSQMKPKLVSVDNILDFVNDPASIESQSDNPGPSTPKQEAPRPASCPLSFIPPLASDSSSPSSQQQPLGATTTAALGSLPPVRQIPHAVKEHLERLKNRHLLLLDTCNQMWGDHQRMEQIAEQCALMAVFHEVVKGRYTAFMEEQTARVARELLDQEERVAVKREAAAESQRSKREERRRAKLREEEEKYQRAVQERKDQEEKEELRAKQSRDARVESKLEDAGYAQMDDEQMSGVLEIVDEEPTMIKTTNRRTNKTAARAKSQQGEFLLSKTSTVQGNAVSERGGQRRGREQEGSCPSSMAPPPPRHPKQVMQTDPKSTTSKHGAKQLGKSRNAGEGSQGAGGSEITPPGGSASSSRCSSPCLSTASSSHHSIISSSRQSSTSGRSSAINPQHAHQHLTAHAQNHHQQQLHSKTLRPLQSDSQGAPSTNGNPASFEQHNLAAVPYFRMPRVGNEAASNGVLYRNVDAPRPLCPNMPAAPVSLHSNKIGHESEEWPSLQVTKSEGRRTAGSNGSSYTNGEPIKDNNGVSSKICHVEAAQKQHQKQHQRTKATNGVTQIEDYFTKEFEEHVLQGNCELTKDSTCELKSAQHHQMQASKEPSLLQDANLEQASGARRAPEEDPLKATHGKLDASQAQNQVSSGNLVISKTGQNTQNPNGNLKEVQPLSDVTKESEYANNRNQALKNDLKKVLSCDVDAGEMRKQGQQVTSTLEVNEACNQPIAAHDASASDTSDAIPQARQTQSEASVPGGGASLPAMSFAATTVWIHRRWGEVVAEHNAAAQRIGSHWNDLRSWADAPSLPPAGLARADVARHRRLVHCLSLADAQLQHCQAELALLQHFAHYPHNHTHISLLQVDLKIAQGCVDQAHMKLESFDNQICQS